MRRLTKREWALINDALALFEASLGDLNFSEAEEERLAKEVDTLREKVFERL